MFNSPPGACFSKVPKVFGRILGHNSLCIFKMKVSWGTKLCSYCNFLSLYNISKDQLNRISGSEFYEWLFGPEKFSELSRKEPQAPVVQRVSSTIQRINHFTFFQEGTVTNSATWLVLYAVRIFLCLSTGTTTPTWVFTLLFTMSELFFWQ